MARRSFLSPSETKVTHLSFGHSVGLFPCQEREVKRLVPALTGCIARLLDLCSEIWFLLEACTCPHLGLLCPVLSEGVREVDLNSLWECTSLFHAPDLWLLWKETRSGQVSARPFFSGTQEVSSVFVWEEGTSSCLHHSLHSFLGSPSLGAQ